MSQQDLIYLDYAAATPMDERVEAVMRPYFSELFYNPSATYNPARQIAKALAAARSVVAQTLGANPTEVIFTAGGTEANNLAIQGIMRAHPDSTIAASVIEHESVLKTAQQFDCREVGVDPMGTVDMKQLAAAIDDTTVLVSIMYVNNEVGTIEPVRDVARMIKGIRSDRRARSITLPIYLHTDAAQAGNYLDIHVARLGVDLMTLNGGKVYGPKQSGILYVKSGVELQPLIYGGGQERGLRNGTENVAASIGCATALQLAQAARAAETERLRALQQQFITLLHTHIPDVIMNGSLKKRLPNNVHITIPGVDNERLLIQLDEAGVLAAAGSACGASSEEPSHVLKAMGISDQDAQSSLRFSMGRQTTEPMIDQAVRILAGFLKRA